MTDALVKAIGLAMFILLSCAHGTPLRSVATTDTTREQAPPYALDLKLQSPHSELALSSFAGRLVLLLISTPGCEACDRLKPGVEGLAERLRSEAFSVSFVTAFLERPSDLESEDSGEGARWADPRLAAGETKLGIIDAVPLTWVLSRHGVPLLRYEGAGDDVVRHLEEDLRGYLRVESKF
jgi:thiol-disulfide isomerase/thioredoxin